MSKRIWKFLHSQSSWLSYKQPGSVSNENDELYTDSNLTIIFKGFLPPFDLSHKNKNKENKTDPWIGLKSNFISRPGTPQICQYEKASCSMHKRTNTG
jgi:hypothetical protein